MKRIAFIGSGDLAIDLCEKAVLWNQYEIAGFIDGSQEKDVIINGYPVLGSDDDVVSLYKEGVFDCIYIAIGYLKFQVREKLYNRFKGVVPLANIISPTVFVHPTSKLGEGIFIGGRCVIDNNCDIEDNVFIHGMTNIGHNNHIQSHTYISGRCNTAGFCEIGKRCFLGICVCIADHIAICDDAWIGLACVVAKNIKEPGKYMSPAAKLYKIE